MRSVQKASEKAFVAAIYIRIRVSDSIQSGTVKTV